MGPLVREDDVEIMGVDIILPSEWHTKLLSHSKIMFIDG